MLISYIQCIALHPKITTRELSDLTNITQLDLAAALNDEVKDGTLTRHNVFVENGTPRSTLCFGWSCLTD